MKAEINRSFRFFAGYALPCSFPICLGNLCKTSHISADNLLRRCYTVWHLSNTMSATQLVSGESSFYNMFLNFSSKMSSAVFRKQAYISLLQSAEARRPLLKKNLRNPKALPSLLFVLSRCFREQPHSHHLHFFRRCVQLMYQTFLKAGRQNCNNVFWPKKMNSSFFRSSLGEETLIFLSAVFYFKNNRSITNYGTCQWWQLLQAVPGRNRDRP